MLVAGFLRHLASNFTGLFTMQPHHFTSGAFDACPMCLRQFSQHGHFPPPDTQYVYSITSSARASNAGGTARPSALAVFMLMTNSYRVGVCTGRSAGFSP